MGRPVHDLGHEWLLHDAEVAVGADGTMAVSWTYQDSANDPSPQQKIQVAVKPATSSTRTTTTLAQGLLGGVSVTEFVPVGIDASGNVTAAWTIWTGTHNVVQAARMPAGGTWSTPVSIAPGVDGIYPSLSVNARGDVGVVYSVTPYAGTNMPNVAQYVFRDSAGTGPNGGWTTPVNVSETVPSSSGYVSTPQVALDGNGLATVMYMGSGVEAARQLSPTSWTAPGPVIIAPNTGSSYLSPDLGVDANGNAVVAVSIFDATIGVDRASVWVARGTPQGVWGPAVRITDPSVPVDAYATRVAVSADGGLAMVGWIDHYHGTVQVSKLVGGTRRAADTTGRGTAFSAFQEVLGLDAGSSTIARAVWKNAKTGTQTMAASYRG